MERMNGLVALIDKKLDDAGGKLKQKEVSLPMDLLGGIIMMVFAIVMLVLMPSQIKIKESDVVNGRVFPSLLMWLMMACSFALIVKECYKMLRGKEVNRVKLNLLVELKALLIFAFMLVFYFVSQATENFAVGACVFSVLMMLFFRCKKWSYYAITITAGVLIWAAFRYGLNVRF